MEEVKFSYNDPYLQFPLVDPAVHLENYITNCKSMQLRRPKLTQTCMLIKIVLALVAHLIISTCGLDCIKITLQQIKGSTDC